MPLSSVSYLGLRYDRIVYSNYYNFDDFNVDWKEEEVRLPGMLLDDFLALWRLFVRPFSTSDLFLLTAGGEMRRNTLVEVLFLPDLDLIESVAAIKFFSDLWEIVAERTIEAKQEAILQQHQSIRVGGFKRRRHVILEHLLMEEKKKRGQMEVSLYSQVIDHLQHHQMFIKPDVRSLTATSKHAVATREKCEAWLNRRHAYPLPNDEAWMENCSVLHGTTLSLSKFANTYDDNWTSDIFNCISPSLPLLNTWVTINVWETFYDALHAERACQTGLIAQALATKDNPSYGRNIALEFLVLHAKMRRAQVETDLYAMAIEHARELDFSDNTSAMLSPS
ncbi:hypothetical protein BD769DRAFT_1387667 [Suillus cothurnatus]|nr:hypothetical protein BD769DRAFT_1387667 [Suillus cothurnatus]